MSTVNISSEHLKIVLKILKKYFPPTTNIWVFGSRSTKSSKIFSDLDLAIDFNNSVIPQDTLYDLTDDFDNSDLPYHVDLIDWNNISVEFKNTIDKTRVILPGW